MMSAPMTTLDIHHTLGGEEVLRAIDVRAEGHPFLRDLTAMRQAEDLIAPAVGEDRARPAIELMQPACLVQGIEPWAQVEVVRIAEDDLRVDVVATARACGQPSPSRPSRQA